MAAELLERGNWLARSFGTPSGDVDGMAGLALSVELPGSVTLLPHSVFGCELVPVVTVSPRSFEMCSMLNEVKVVLGHGPIRNIAGNVVELVSIKMPSDSSVGWAMENQSYDLVDSEISLSAPIVPVEKDFGVSLVIDAGAEDTAGRPRSLDRINVALGIDAVVAESWDTDPGPVFDVDICHANEDTPQTEVGQMSSSNTVGAKNGS